MKISLRHIPAILAVALGAISAWAQNPPPPPAEAHQFDFWLGEWDVTTPAGKPAGASRIQSIAGGHALLENWEGAGGGTGKSLNAYNAAKKQWQQFWVDGTGGVLELAGGFAEGHMVLGNSTRKADGTSVQNRITWTPNPDGSVRQLWEQSADEGKTWQVAFDGIYRHSTK